MRAPKPKAWLLLLLMLTSSSQAADVVQTHALDGTCEQLIIDGTDLSDQCGTALVQLVYDDGGVAVSAGTGGQSFFGLGEPERMLMFAGPGNSKLWTDHAVHTVFSGAADGGEPLVIEASGICTYEQAPPGLLITCRATDLAGGEHGLIYRTNGLDGFSF
jgi:hypothetical protein